jgi:ATP-dependent Lhr-like helicase
LDDAPLEERRSRAVEMRRVLPPTVLAEIGKLDPAAIAQVREDAWPDVRNSDELHDALQTLIAIPEQMPMPRGSTVGAEWARYFDALVAERRAGRAVVAGRGFWVAAERAAAFQALYPEAHFDIPPAELRDAIPERSEALLALTTGWMQHIGPASAASLGDLLALPAGELDQALLRLEAAGSILRGWFTIAPTKESDALATEFCERRLLARIHRLTVGTLRKQVEPVTPAVFMRWLLRWQHIEPGSQLSGERGLVEVLRQLQGFEIPANAWERDIFARRMSDYDPKLLDQLCLSGVVGWGRLSPHPATLETTGDGEANRRVIPTKVAPITFFVREEADWMDAHQAPAPDESVRALSPVARQVLDLLRQRGASFFADIVRGSGRLKSEIETGLWELVAAGLVTADGFDNLRSLIDPKRRAGQGSGRTARPRHSAGRWALLHPGSAHNAPPEAAARAVEATCMMLLQRWGIVFRELLARETNLPRWRELLIAFRRLEDRGEIRGGRFVDGFLGEQFALPVAVESLRASRNLPADDRTITVSAADPLNVVGIIVPGERVPAISGKTVAYRNGVAVAAEERGSVLGAAGVM